MFKLTKTRTFADHNGLMSHIIFNCLVMVFLLDWCVSCQKPGREALSLSGMWLLFPLCTQTSGVLVDTLNQVILVALVEEVHNCELWLTVMRMLLSVTYCITIPKQYPVRPSIMTYDDVNHLSAKIKPKQQKVSKAMYLLWKPSL